MDDGGRHFLFGITVSEIAFILFFVLLLFSFFAIANLERENTAEKSGRAEAENSLGLIAVAFGQGADLDEDAALTILKKGAEATEKVEQQKLELQDLRVENKRLRDEGNTAKQQVKQSEGELKETKGQLVYLQEQAGVGDPPCWVAGESGEIEFLFRVELFGDETVRVRREAPARRNKDYRALPSVPEITSRRLQMSEFKSLSLPIYQTGEQSEPQCRHFVRVNFADQEACRFLLVVERFYYKSVYGNDSTICTG